MGFDLSGGDLSHLESHLKTRSYIEGYEPSQADVSVFKDIKSAPSADKYPNSARWYSHIDSYASEHSSLPGEAGKPSSAYGADSTPTAIKEVQAQDTTSKDAKAGNDDEDDIDLFGSDDDEEEESQEAKDLREKRLAEYNAKKAGKTKPAAKSIVTLDVKPWDDETDMKELEAGVRAIEMDGLVRYHSLVVGCCTDPTNRPSVHPSSSRSHSASTASRSRSSSRTTRSRSTSSRSASPSSRTTSSRPMLSPCRSCRRVQIIHRQATNRRILAHRVIVC